jgi:DNA-directed RNA polymerase subunit RPC12/RpoP
MRLPTMHSIADAFLEQRTQRCPTCFGFKRVYMEGKQVECYHCGGKGFLKLSE